MSRRRFLLGAASLAVVPLVGCGRGGSSGSAGGANTVRVLTPHGAEIYNEFKRGFNAKYPDVRLDFASPGATTGILTFVLSQFKGKAATQGINYDVMFGGGAETFLELEKANALQPLPSDYGIPQALNGVPLRDKNWVGAALSGFGILANKVIADRDGLPLPKVWSDLANPKYRGRIELADPRQSGSAHTAYEVILQTNGWEKGWQVLTAMAGNASSFVDSSSQLTIDVGGGQAVFAPAIDFYGVTAVERSGGKLVYIAPQGQNVITPDPIAILRGAPHLEAARQFVAFVMSPEGQKLWMLNKGTPGGPQQNTLYRSPALPSLYKPISPNSAVKVNPYDAKNARPYDAAKATARRLPLDDLIGSILVDNQGALKRAWATNPNAAKLAYLPVSEAQLAQLALKWDDPKFKNATVSAWRQGAQAKYAAG